MNTNRLFRKFLLSFLGFVLIPFMIILVLFLTQANRLQLHSSRSQNENLTTQTVNSVMQQIQLAENMCKTVIQNQSLIDFLDKQYETMPDLMYYRTTIHDFVKVTNGVSDIKLRIYLENPSIPPGFGIFYPMSYICGTDAFLDFYQNGDLTDIWLDGGPEAFAASSQSGKGDTLHYLHKIRSGSSLIGVIEAAVPKKVFLLPDLPSESAPQPDGLKDLYIYNYSSLPLEPETLSYIESGPPVGEAGPFMYTSCQIPDRPFHLLVLSERPQLTGLAVVLILLLPLLFCALMAGFFGYNRRMIRDIHHCLDGMEAAIAHNFEPQSSRLHALAVRKDEISVLANRITYLLSQIQTLLEQKVQEQTAAKQAELLALQHQINPHFLYNTMEIFSSRMELAGLYEDSAAISAFCKMLRYNINSRELVTTLEDEIKLVRYYLAIQNIRGIPFQIRFDISSQLLSERCIRFLLEPFIENSFKYRGEADPLQISIGAVIQENDIVFTIENNGEALSHERILELNERFQNAPVSVETGGERIGLSNINSRLKLFYGERHYIQVSCENGRTVFCFSIERRPPDGRA